LFLLPLPLPLPQPLALSLPLRLPPTPTTQAAAATATAAVVAAVVVVVVVAVTVAVCHRGRCRYLKSSNLVQGAPLSVSDSVVLAADAAGVAVFSLAISDVAAVAVVATSPLAAILCHT